MSKHQSAQELLDGTFLETRHKIIDVAAAFDRIERGDGADSAETDPRMKQLRKAIGLLTDGAQDRAERVQMLFSDPYDPGWRDK